jgi:hypothetical protein
MAEGAPDSLVVSLTDPEFFDRLWSSLYAVHCSALARTRLRVEVQEELDAQGEEWTRVGHVVGEEIDWNECPRIGQRQ